MIRFSAIFSFVMALMVSSYSVAQTEQGRWLVGGSFELSFPTGDENSGTLLGINPTVGYFALDNVAIGAGLPFAVAGNDDFTSSSIGIAPFGRYYFAINDKVVPFFEAGFSIIRYRLEVENAIFDDVLASETEFSGGFGIGIAYFLSEHVALEGILEYTGENYRQFGIRSQVSLGAGFQIYLP